MKSKSQKLKWFFEIQNESWNEKHGQIIKAMARDVRIDDMILGVGFCVLIGFRNSDFGF